MGTMTDSEWDQLIKGLSAYCHRRAAMSLMAGNDTGCFSTGQYKEAYCRYVDVRKVAKVPIDPGFYDRTCGEDWARRALLKMPDLVREVRPDVWRYVGCDDVPTP